MALPCLGYLFETDFLCMCCSSCLYPLIRDRCGSLGNHQKSKKLPLWLFLLSHSLFPAQMWQRMALFPCVLPVRSTLHSCQRTEWERKHRKARVASDRMGKQETARTRGSIPSKWGWEEGGTLKHAVGHWVKVKQDLPGPEHIGDLQSDTAVWRCWGCRGEVSPADSRNIEEEWSVLTTERKVALKDATVKVKHIGVTLKVSKRPRFWW